MNIQNLSGADRDQFDAWVFEFGADSGIKPEAEIVLGSGATLTGAEVQAYLQRLFPARRVRWNIKGRFILPSAVA